MQKRDKKSALWERRRAQYRSSGLIRRAFCEKHHLSTLDYWFCRLGKQEKAVGVGCETPAQSTPVPDLPSLLRESPTTAIR
jgi:hypothetical protein